MPTRRHYNGKEIQPFVKMNPIRVISCNNNVLWHVYQSDFLGSREDQSLPFKYVAAGFAYINSEEFLDAVENIPGVVYFIAIPSWFYEPVVMN